MLPSAQVAQVHKLLCYQVGNQGEPVPRLIAIEEVQEIVSKPRASFARLITRAGAS